MRILTTIQLKAMLREPQAISENQGGSRLSKILNLFYFSNTPIARNVYSKVQETGPRSISSNIQ
jgi:hypothetical protein